MGFPWEKLGSRALLTFFSGPNAYSYCEHGKLYRWISDNPSAQKDQKITGIDRVCFHDPKAKKRIVRV